MANASAALAAAASAEEGERGPSPEASAASAAEPSESPAAPREYDAGEPPPQEAGGGLPEEEPGRASGPGAVADPGPHRSGAEAAAPTVEPGLEALFAAAAAGGGGGGGGGDGGDRPAAAPSATLPGAVPAPPSAAQAVAPDRKRELLLRAREDRALWVGRVPAPWREGEDPKRPPEGGLWFADDRFRSVADLPAVQRVPSALPLLTHLYRLGAATGPTAGDRRGGVDGSPDPVDATAQRLREVLRSERAAAAAAAAEDRNQGERRSARVGRSSGNPIPASPAGSDPDYGRAYHSLWQRLHHPSSAALVQGMRRFCRQQIIEDDSLAGWSDAAQRIRSYASASAANASHWAEKEEGEPSSAATAVRARALEAFLHGQCRERVFALGWTEEARRRDDEWRKRWSELRFVGPRHLDVACLARLPTRQSDAGDDREGGGGGEAESQPPPLYLEDALRDAVQALEAVDLYHSPYDKLQQLLAVYRCVNAALAQALNPPTDTAAPSSAPATPPVLPSADDVLPTVILTVLSARPDRLPLNLQFVEQCCPPDALRGEAGYAFTNLYGALQFLLDLDPDRPSDVGLSPSTDPDEFRRTWLACREQTAAADPEPEDRVEASTDANAESRWEHAVWMRDLPPVEVRNARRNGESLDVDWALDWWRRQEQQQQQQPPPYDPVAPAPTIRTSRAESVGGLEDAVAEDLPSVGLSRSHRFLTARPEDVRLSDLPQLLEEYRRLVHASERLRSERAARSRAERREQRRAAERALCERAKDIEPLLLAAAAELGEANGALHHGRGQAPATPSQTGSPQ